MRSIAAIALVLLLVTSPLAVPMASAATDSGRVAATDSIVRTMTFSLTPSEPGSVTVVVSYDLPSSVDSLTTTVPETASVAATDGFSRESNGDYTWDGGVSTPSLTLSVDANQTGSGLRSQSTGEGYEFVDAGPWAIVSTPPMSTSWEYYGDAVDFERRTRVDGAGVAGEQMVYLGPSESYATDAAGQRITLVVPERASLSEEPSAILESLSAASNSLRVGERDRSVLFIAAPNTVEWGAAGLAADADAWVLADSTLNSADNVWLHEYVHTRTGFTPTSSTQWVIEGSAEYYAGLLSLQQGLISFDEFADHLELGEREPYASSVLSRPSSWSQGAQYLKGGLVFGTLDREMRLETDSSAPASALLARLNENDEPVTHSMVGSEIDELAGPSSGDHYDRYATTTQVPSMWTRSEHSAAFDTLPPQMIVGDLSFAVSGPYRDVHTTPPPVLVPGETLTVVGTLTNEGDATGDYAVEMNVDGTTVDSVSGRLDGQETTDVSLSTTFESVGVYEVQIGGEVIPVTVEEPAQSTVTSVSLEEATVSPEEPVVATVTVENPESKPATGTIPVLVDEEEIQVINSSLDVGETATYTVTFSVESPGVHTVAVGSESRQFSVEGDGSSGTETSVPGVSILGVVLAILVVSFSFLVRKVRM